MKPANCDGNATMSRVGPEVIRSDSKRDAKYTSAKLTNNDATLINACWAYTAGLDELIDF
jgi:hypothetical protein